ncbi:hypothetical protein BZA05DRAFT_409098 [Tricharina praecox]|uniref:uncharacterized protein n=1 Tax=Tricharina praecox TaxID=43433 RepID=UPI002220A3F7|nr:uncharacterized protein BZA05DRAFT_413671 [Tricharina praecox]XP_051336013.1 uncharacterized protein BZA05DRAFT_409098 [Tricharina praecox]KAI5840946.1 hypothetical protein BZA05DRAFT_413671 [Tricharina praecox]KAI5844686.1 hypothetical protein BZA05DRAFT_409098 [Tricharina praecox]
MLFVQHRSYWSSTTAIHAPASFAYACSACSRHRFPPSPPKIKQWAPPPASPAPPLRYLVLTNPFLIWNYTTTLHAPPSFLCAQFARALPPVSSAPSPICDYPTNVSLLSPIADFQALDSSICSCLLPPRQRFTLSRSKTQPWTHPPFPSGPPPSTNS